jgi:hypothetical protein
LEEVDKEIKLSKKVIKDLKSINFRNLPEQGVSGLQNIAVKLRDRDWEFFEQMGHRLIKIRRFIENLQRVEDQVDNHMKRISRLDPSLVNQHGYFRRELAAIRNADTEFMRQHRIIQNKFYQGFNSLRNLLSSAASLGVDTGDFVVIKTQFEHILNYLQNEHKVLKALHKMVRRALGEIKTLKDRLKVISSTGTGNINR